MPTVSVLDAKGKQAGEVKLDDSIFGIEPNAAVMHQVVTAHLAGKRAGTHNTKTRAEKRGGGAKPWRQKGTGRARHGSIRSPQWRGGGVAHGPKPRDYSQRTPKKMNSLALRSALSDRTQESKLLLVKEWSFGEAPSTKTADTQLKAIGTEGNVLVVLPRDAETAFKSFKNLKDVNAVAVDQLNTYDILVSDFVVIQESCLDSLIQKSASKANPVPQAKASKASKSPEAAKPSKAAKTETSSKSKEPEEEKDKKEEAESK